MSVPVLLTAFLALAVGGCGDDDGETQATTAPEREQSAQPPEGDGQGPEGVPLPEGAESTGRASWEVPATTFQEVVDFYESELPEGQNFGSWEWCDTGGGETIHSHIYSKSGRRILGVTVTDANPPGVLIVADRSGPC